MKWTNDLLLFHSKKHVRTFVPDKIFDKYEFDTLSNPMLVRDLKKRKRTRSYKIKKKKNTKVFKTKNKQRKKLAAITTAVSF